MYLTLKQIRHFIILVFFIFSSLVFGYWLGKQDIRISWEKKKPKIKFTNTTFPSDKEIDFSLFWRVWEKLEEKYLDKSALDKEKMFYGAIQGMTAAIGDPYTVFLPPWENQKVKEDLNGSFEGVGLQLGFNKEKKLVVISALKGTPAYHAGIKAGDLILHIKDESKGIDQDTYSLSLPEAVEKIRGPKNTSVKLTLLHENEEEPFEVEIKRDTIIVPSVEKKFVNEKGEEKENGQFAYLHLLKFGDLTTEQWNEAITQIKNREKFLKGMILDLRGNPGGYLNGAVTLASEFLNKGIIVKQVNYKGETETYSVNRKGRLLEIPLVVLIDKGSASASEILAAALREHNRAKIVGEESFGKGTIQESEEIEEKAALHITTAKWLTPNNIWFNEKGLIPDIYSKDDLKTEKIDEALIDAIKILEEKQ